VIFKHNKKEAIVNKILQKAQKEKSASPLISEFTYQGVSFRLYVTGKAIFRKMKAKSELENLLSDLLE